MEFVGPQVREYSSRGLFLADLDGLLLGATPCDFVRLTRWSILPLRRAVGRPTVDSNGALRLASGLQNGTVTNNDLQTRRNIMPSTCSISRLLNQTFRIMCRPGHSCRCPSCGDRRFWIQAEDQFAKCYSPGCGLRISFGSVSQKPKSRIPPGRSILDPELEEQNRPSEENDD
jgi:hypothetical protein